MESTGLEIEEGSVEGLCCSYVVEIVLWASWREKTTRKPERSTGVGCCPVCPEASEGDGFADTQGNDNHQGEGG